MTIDAKYETSYISFTGLTITSDLIKNVTDKISEYMDDSETEITIKTNNGSTFKPKLSQFNSCIDDLVMKGRFNISEITVYASTSYDKKTSEKTTIFVSYKTSHYYASVKSTDEVTFESIKKFLVEDFKDKVEINDWNSLIKRYITLALSAGILLGAVINFGFSYGVWSILAYMVSAWFIFLNFIINENKKKIKIIA